MSWNRSTRGRGVDVAAWTAGAFAAERGNPSHSEETRQLLEVHERVIHVFALHHHDDEVEVTSSGHFTKLGERHGAAGESRLSTIVRRFSMPIRRNEPDDDRTERLLGEAHQMQRTLTDAHAPSVIHGVTTPITPSEDSGDGQAQGNEEGQGEGILILKPGAGLLPPADDDSLGLLFVGEGGAGNGEGAESEEEMGKPGFLERLREKLGQ